MKKSETTTTRDAFAKPQQPKLEAPIRLTPEQLESIAAGHAALPSGGGSEGAGGTMGRFPSGTMRLS